MVEAPGNFGGSPSPNKHAHEILVIFTLGGGATENDSNRQVYRQNITFLFYDQAQGGKDQDII